MLKKAASGALAWLRNRTIRTKLLLSFCLLIFLPLLILTAVSYHRVAAYSESRIRFSAGQSFDQAYTLLSYRVSTLLNASQMVCFSSDVQTVLKREQAQTDIIQQNVDMTKLDAFFFNILASQNVYRVSLYVPGWMMFADQNVDFFSMDRFRKTDNYKRLMECKDIALWTLPATAKGESSLSDSTQVISLVRRIRDVNMLNDTIGAVQVSIPESNVRDILARANATPHSVCFLLNSRNEVVCSSNSAALNAFLPSAADREIFLGRDIAWKSVRDDGRSFLISSRAVDNTDWKLVNLIPLGEIYTQSDKIRNLMLLLMLVLGLIACSLAYLFSTSITQRIQLLLANMTLVQNGNFDLRVSSSSHDEIGRLIDNFNFMVNKIKRLMEEQFAAGREIMNAELKALQAQINPHFLYNTLDMINWKALDNNVPEIAEISQALTKFYKSTLSGGRDLVTMREEKDYLETYVKIQNVRYENRIHLVFDIPDALLPLRILKLLLQPLVENAILHGILCWGDGRGGTVRVIARAKGGDLFLTVRDDGVGMSESEAAGLFSAPRVEKKRGYGVWNIHQRIQLCYGGAYGLTFRSAPGRGTAAVLRLPKLEESPEPDA